MFDLREGTGCKKVVIIEPINYTQECLEDRDSGSFSSKCLRGNFRAEALACTCVVRPVHQIDGEITAFGFADPKHYDSVILPMFTSTIHFRIQSCIEHRYSHRLDGLGK